MDKAHKGILQRTLDYRMDSNVFMRNLYDGIIKHFNAQ